MKLQHALQTVPSLSTVTFLSNLCVATVLATNQIHSTDTINTSNISYSFSRISASQLITHTQLMLSVYRTSSALQSLWT